MELRYGRCPNDDWRAGSARVGVNPKTGDPIEININGVSAVLSIHSALSALTAAMKAGHEEDFIEKIVLALLPKVQDDPHCLCPLLAVLGEILLLLQGTLTVGSDSEGHVIFHPPESEELTGQGCMFDDDEEGDEDVDDEETLGDDAGEGGEGIAP